MQSYTGHISKRIPLQDLLPLEMPIGLCLEPVNLCNFKCTCCPVSLLDYKSVVKDVGMMDLDLYKKILGDIKVMGKLKKLNLYGDGEPLLHKNIPDMVRLAIQEDVAFPISITSNASLLTEELAVRLIESGLHYFRASVYSVREKRHAEITRSSTSVTDIFNNIKRFVEIRDKLKSKTPYIYVKMIDTYSRENDDFLKLYSPIADEANIETPMNWNSYDNIDLISKVDPNQKTDQTLIQGFYNQRGASGYKRICTTAFHSLNIKHNGDVVICIVDWNKGTKVGNIKEQSLSEIWFGEELRQFRSMHVENRRSENISCRNCKYLYNNPDNIDHLPQDQLYEIINHKMNTEWCHLTKAGEHEH